MNIPRNPLTGREPGTIPDPFFWRNTWRRMMIARLAEPGFMAAGSYWNDRKNVQSLYVKSRSRRAWSENVAAQFSAMAIPSGARVLDIGGGAGTHAIPLARRGCDVTVVEPSAAMREELEKNLPLDIARSLRVIPSRWEDVPATSLGEPYDIVMASYSLSMVDIGEAIAKMESSCRGSVHLFWFLSPPSWARVSHDLWPPLYGRDYPGEPLADCLLQVLYEMGIAATLLTECKGTTVYPSVADAVRVSLWRLGCTTREQEAVLEGYFSSNLRPVNNGLALEGDSYGAHLFWHSRYGVYGGDCNDD